MFMLMFYTDTYYLYRTKEYIKLFTLIHYLYLYYMQIHSTSTASHTSKNCVTSCVVQKLFHNLTQCMHVYTRLFSMHIYIYIYIYVLLHLVEYIKLFILIHYLYLYYMQIHSTSTVQTLCHIMCSIEIVSQIKTQCMYVYTRLFSMHIYIYMYMYCYT